jgi:hypothetical protein
LTCKSGAELCLSVCDVHACEARCCYDGVYLQADEERDLRSLVAREPTLQQRLPVEFIVDGYWDGKLLGRKTATRPHEYRSPDYPAHFARTRCVFADAAGFCELQKLALEQGLHPWAYKPTTCWMFPLQDDDGVPAAPVASPDDDPYATDSYPGYANFVPCGRHDPQGRPWREALQKEIAWLEMRGAEAKKTPP